MLGRYIDAINPNMDLTEHHQNLTINEKILPNPNLSEQTKSHLNGALKGSDFVAFRYGFGHFISALQDHLRDKCGCQTINSTV